MRIALFLSSIFVLAVSTQSFGQASTCTQTLRLARSTYEQGRLHELPGLLKNCLDTPDGFTKSERVEAYKILTNTYIYLEEPALADETMLKLLQSDHFFEVNPEVDPAEFTSLYAKFRTKQIFRYGVKIGVNGTLASAIENHYVGDASVGQGKYSPKVGFQVGFVFEKDYFEKFTLAPELMFTTRSFTYTNSRVFTIDSLLEQGGDANGAEVISIAKQSWIDLNAIVKYRMGDQDRPDTKFIPYVGIGPGVSYLLAGKNQITTTATGGKFTVSGPDVDLKNSMNQIVYSVIVMAGAKIRLGELYLTGDIRYQYGISNVINGATRSSQEAVFDYATQQNDYRQSNVSFNVGVLIPYFNPKKLIK